MLSFQDRLHLNRHFIFPMVLLPSLLCTAAISFTCMLIVVVLIPVILALTHWYCKSHAPHTRFFFAWALTSITCLWAIFEITVPLLELLPEENLIFRLCLFGSIACFYWVSQVKSVRGGVAIISEMLTSKQAPYFHSSILSFQVRKLAPLSVIRSSQNDRDDSEPEEARNQTLLLMEQDDYDDQITEAQPPRHRSRRNVSSRSAHCDICQQTILNRYHHSRWLDCCISESNVGLFLMGCGTGMFGLLFGANLALTSICHPFYFFSLFGIKILMPDDCSDVFDQYE